MPLGTSIQVTHKFVSGKADGADGTLVQPSKWNQAENFSAGSDGQVPIRDSSANEGASWVDAGAAYSVCGLVGANNAITPNTKFDLAADLVVLRHPTLGYGRTQTNTGTITNDTGLAGPAANGRDVAGAFASSIWIHFYFIWGNGQTLATLSSATAPPTGPALPANYTHWAYAGAVFYNATPLLVKTRFVGSTAFYEGAPQVLTTGGATVETTISLTGTVPPNAKRIRLRLDAAFNDTVAAHASTANIRFISGVNHSGLRCDNQAAGSTGSDNEEIEVPNIGQQVFYLWIDITGVTSPTRSLDVYVMGYSMPNGGE